jgi:hypothetical protein
VWNHVDRPSLRRLRGDDGPTALGAHWLLIFAAGQVGLLAVDVASPIFVLGLVPQGWQGGALLAGDYLPLLRHTGFVAAGPSARKSARPSCSG